MNNATCETCQRKQGTTCVALDEFYLKNHLGSTVAVMDNGAVSTLKSAYDYRATMVAMRTKQQVAKCCPPFGEQVDLEQKGDKVTENFTGIRLRGECCEHACMFIAEPMGLGAKRKERDDETQLNYFGARYLDPMLGLWISVDAARQHFSPYTYGSNNPVMRTDPDGNADGLEDYARSLAMNNSVNPQMEAAFDISLITIGSGMAAGAATVALAGVATGSVGRISSFFDKTQTFILGNNEKIKNVGDFASGVVGEMIYEEIK